MTLTPPRTPPARPAPTTPHRSGDRPEARRKPRTAPTGPAAALLARIPRLDRDVLWLYFLTRIALWTTAYATRHIFPADGDARHAETTLSAWAQWDWVHYMHIARDGYFPDTPGPDLRPGDEGWDNREAFFPGFPLLLRAVHTAVPNWTAAGLLISLAAGAVAVLALARIARHHFGDDRTARLAVLFLLVSPCAVFLAAGYTEALFLALALPAWLAALRGNWPHAALLACLASSVRVSGLFLTAALAVHYATTATTEARRRKATAHPRRPAEPRPSPWRHLPWLALPALPPALYTWYLHTRTGDWMAWKHAEERGWHRRFHAPWDAWQTTWNAAFDNTYPTGYAVEWQAELLAMAVGVTLATFLLVRRRWAEATYVALSLWALGTSYWYMSIPRATLLWWPLWIMLAAAAHRRPYAKTAYLALTAPLSTLLAATYLSGRWAG
ncbi:mannosyltransferase family protein [Streptodolium elevatio]|uniref:Mannosyltransferase family protein n=1 Tax=Streptodolium elevatio TaxID=3157996 RepID=A0ABV3DGP3_9ACTN